MRPLSGFRNRTEIEPKRTESRQIIRQSRAGAKLSCEESSWAARPIAHSLSSDERIMRILGPTPSASEIDPSGTKLRRVSGTPNIGQEEFRIGLHTLGT